MCLFIPTELPDNIMLSMQKMDNGEIAIYYNAKCNKTIESVSGYSDSARTIENCIRPKELRRPGKRKMG